MVAAVLRSLLVDDLFGEVSEKDGRRFIRLKETGANAKLKKVDIYDIPADSLLIKLDKYKQPKSLFKGENGERKRCDYVLATAIDDRPLLVFMEMKSTTVKDSEIQRQFKGAECVLDYCDAVLDRFHGHDGVLRQCEKRFVILYKSRSINK